ncbi:MAG TPA: hypothetical protein VMJ35_12060 [Dongiaceae bacterium]|nr:hypothetical protein [Dongiaceae bacterium]
MSRTAKSNAWTRRTIDRAISLWGLIQITRAARDVELRSPATRCPKCGRLAELVVLPGSKCGSCWSEEIIENWRVVPGEMAVVSVNATTTMRRRKRQRV